MAGRRDIGYAEIEAWEQHENAGVQNQIQFCKPGGRISDRAEYEHTVGRGIRTRSGRRQQELQRRVAVGRSVAGGIVGSGDGFGDVGLAQQQNTDSEADGDNGDGGVYE